MDSEYPNRCPECDQSSVRLTSEDGAASHFACENCGHEWSVEF